MDLSYIPMLISSILTGKKIFKKEYKIPLLILLIYLVLGFMSFLVFGFNLIVYTIFSILLIATLFLLYYFGLLSIGLLIILSSIALLSYTIFYSYIFFPYNIYQGVYSYQQLVPVVVASPIY